MRERKLGELAGNLNYPAGGNPWNGLPTKIAPPSTYITNGKWPGDAFAAQWQNYIENTLHRQIEVSAQIPFRNFTDLSAVLPALTSTPRFAYNRKAGATMVANGVNNSVKYYQDLLDAQGTAAPLGVTLSPSSSPFIPKCVIAYEAVGLDGWFVGGQGATATKSIFRIGRNGAQTEITTPFSGSIECLTSDPETGDTYGFVADANRSMIKLDRFTNGVTSITQRGGSFATPAVASTYAATGAGWLIHALTPGGGFVQWEYTSTSSIAWNSAYSGVLDTSIVLDARYSVQLGLFMVLTSDKLITFATPAGAVQTYSHIGYGGGTITLEGGCLTDTGFVGYNDGDGQTLLVCSWPGDVPFALKYGGMGDTTGVFARYDGSAIWFMQDRSGTKKLFRSLRSN